MSAATRPAAGRAGGAQYVKAMLLAIGEAENKAYDLGDEAPAPALLAPIIEAHVAAANGSGVVGFRGGFYEALAEWLAPTVDCGTICSAGDWQPLAEKVETLPAALAAPEAASSSASTAAPVAAPLGVSAGQANELFHAIAITALTAQGLALIACEAAGDTDAAEAIHGLQRLFETIGALADSGVATGQRARGTLAQWVCGPLYSEPGAGATPAQG